MNRSNHTLKTPARDSLSHQAEEIVTRALQAQGWQILRRNFQRHSFELDIVARKEQTLIIVEVKARRSWPLHGVDYEGLVPYKKQQALRRGARACLTLFAQMNIAKVRLDLALVLLNRETKRAASIQYFVDAVPLE